MRSRQPICFVWNARLSALAAVCHRFLSPLGYAQLVWATLFGYVVFGDFPDSRAFIGMAIIVASRLYVALGHRFKAREIPETQVE